LPNPVTNPWRLHPGLFHQNTLQHGGVR